RSSAGATYGVEIRPPLVATMKRLPQRTTESTLPNPGTICPGVTFQTPLGPSITAVPLTTGRRSCLRRGSAPLRRFFACARQLSGAHGRSGNGGDVWLLRRFRRRVPSDLTDDRIV